MAWLPFQKINYLFSWRVRLGDQNLNSTDDDRNSIEKEVQATNTHPKYLNGLAYYDAALLKIPYIEFTFFIRPICLPSSSSLDPYKYDDKTATVTGWGTQFRLGKTSSRLKKAIVTIYDYK